MTTWHPIRRPTRSRVTGPPPNQPPSASFTPSCNGLSCAFTNTSTDADGTMTHAWSFGDGTGSTAVSPPHTYGSAGTFTVTLDGDR